MDHNRVLIVSDSPDRRNFLQYHIRSQNLSPIWYPNIISARKAVRSDLFSLVVVDLSLPIDQKLTLVQEACRYRPEVKTITIGKMEYLAETGAFSSLSTVVSLDSIDLFPDTLAEYCHHL